MTVAVSASHRTARGASIEVCEGTDGHHFGLPRGGYLQRRRCAQPGPVSIELWQASLNVPREGNHLGYGKSPEEAIRDAWRMRAQRFARAIWATSDR